MRVSGGTRNTDGVKGGDKSLTRTVLPGVILLSAADRHMYGSMGGRCRCGRCGLAARGEPEESSTRGGEGKPLHVSTPFVNADNYRMRALTSTGVIAAYGEYTTSTQ
jgi:hypothetical protein